MRPDQMRASDQLLYHIVRGLLHLLGRFPENLRRCCAVLLGRCFYTVDRKHRRIAIQNLQRAFGSERTADQIQVIARRVFENLFHIVFELGWSLHLPDKALSDHVTLHGLDAYKTAMAKGRGVLFLAAHFGNWELLTIVGYLGNIPIRIVYRPLDTPFLDRFFKERRSRFGGQPLPTRRGAMRQIYKALKHGYPVAMLMDQNVDWYEGVFADFFNHRACTSTGMALLALKSGAPVLPCFLIRTKNGFHAVLGPELTTIRTGDARKDVELNTQMYNRVIEIYARRFPDQWFWVHQRWKTRPYSPWPRK
jgi:KDO2-lipid IV(A) lauroyltransferase